MTAIEDAMRFRPVDGTAKVYHDTHEARNAVGYRVRMVKPRAPYSIRLGQWNTPRRPQFDVFGPGGWIGVEPDLWWAMKLADAHYCRSRRGAA